MVAQLFSSVSGPTKILVGFAVSYTLSFAVLGCIHALIKHQPLPWNSVGMLLGSAIFVTTVQFGREMQLAGKTILAYGTLGAILLMAIELLLCILQFDIAGLLTGFAGLAVLSAAATLSIKYKNGKISIVDKVEI